MKPRKWCRHIYKDGPPMQWNIDMKFREVPYAVQHTIPPAWRMCPICGAERPTRENIRAAQLRAAMDAGDDE